MVRVEVRALSPDDWETTRDLRLAALLDAPEAFGANYADTSKRSEQQWREWPTNGQAFGAWVDGEPMGMASGWIDPDEPKVTALIAMWVSPAARGRGLAAALIDAVTGWARAQGSEAVELNVYDSNTTARESYLKNGFIPVRTNVYDGKPGSIMRLDLS